MEEKLSEKKKKKKKKSKAGDESWFLFSCYVLFVWWFVVSIFYIHFVYEIVNLV